MELISRRHSEQEIDNIVIAEANNRSKWTRPTLVTPPKSLAVFLTPRVSKKVKSMARKRHIKNYHKWISRIVERHLAERP